MEQQFNALKSYRNLNQEPLYDDIAISTGLSAGQEVALFTSGQSGGKQIIDTNVIKGGQIPWRYMAIWGLSVTLVARGNASVLTTLVAQDLLNATQISLEIDYKAQYNQPSWVFSSPFGLNTNGNATDYATNGLPYAKNIFTFPVIEVTPAMNLKCTAKFFNGTTTIPNEATVYFYVFLQGNVEKAIN